MTTRNFKYVIVGTGLAGCHAVEGIRTLDTTEPILLLGNEQHLPYDRPPLTKKLWFGKKKVEEIFIHDRQYYADNGVTVAVNTTVADIDPEEKALICTDGTSYRYEKLLLATGGIPRRLPIEGSQLDEVYYYRYLDDFLHLKSHVHAGVKALVIGGNFIGSEIAAALNINQANVTMLVHGTYPVERVFPQALAAKIYDDYIRRGVTILTGDEPVSIIRRGRNLFTRTKRGREIVSEVVVAGIGIEPETQLAASAGLRVDDGILVNEFLQTSALDIYAAGDNAHFPYTALGRSMRVEHWDNAVNQGKTAGRNMAGANTSYTYMPYFFSDLFDFGYEAVGMCSSKLETYADWQKENDTGVVYYLEDGRVVGAMMCNVWGKVDAARELIRSREPVAEMQLQGAVR
jgi:3-phenylpropionate/trans-cinnamate dioxygenase ferredoxin reductase component